MIPAFSAAYCFSAEQLTYNRYRKCNPYTVLNVIMNVTNDLTMNSGGNQMTKLTDALGVAPEGPVPFGRSVAPPTILSDQNVSRIAIEFDKSARCVGESAFPSVFGSRQSTAGNHWIIWIKIVIELLLLSEKNTHSSIDLPVFKLLDFILTISSK